LRLPSHDNSDHQTSNCGQALAQSDRCDSSHNVTPRN
jgi:hypothetical protein